MNNVRFTYHVRPLPKLGKIRTQNECDRGEHILNIIMVIVAVIVIAAYGWMLHQHDARMEAAIETETEYTFNRGSLFDE